MLGGVYLYMRYVPTYELGNPSSAQRPPKVMPSSGPAAGDHGHAAMAVPAAPVVRSVEQVFGLLLVISIAAFLVLGAVGAVVGWIMAGRMLRPLKAINAVAQRAAEGDLRQRVQADGPHDELRDLSETFDDMLGKLERSFGEHQRFAANASHELRTPIATTHTLLQVALSDPKIDLPALRTVAQRVSEMNRRNQATVESLLALAEAGSSTLKREEVDLEALVREALLLELDAIREQHLDVSSHVTAERVTADRVLVAQALRNLVQNAVRHNADGGAVHIRVTGGASGAVIDVENDGPDLSPTNVESLIEPFMRGTGRAVGSSTRGHGLGLALVQSVATAHSGTLRLSARQGGGLRAVLTLPPPAAP